MIITRTPFRISFFGGGTDYPDWYHENGGAVISTTINKYCYINCRYFPPYFNTKNRIVWSRIELANEPDEIFHPSVREILKFLKVKDGIEVHHSADLPANAGMGSSSAFTVGLMKALHKLEGRDIDKMQLAKDSIHIEQNLIGEKVGSQDQTAVAFGGFNKILFEKDNEIKVTPINISEARRDELDNNLILVFTGFSRIAPEIVGEQIKNIPKKKEELKKMRQMVEDAEKILESGNLDDFGKLLHETWQIKRGLSTKITNDKIDEIYDIAMKEGALGGKLLGAGAGGFMLFYAKPDAQERIKKKLDRLIHVPFKFESDGSAIINDSREL